jgi:hypothetical protein
MRQLYEKSGSSAKFADFAFDVRKVVKADNLPEYAVTIDRNEEGDEVVRMLRRSRLSADDPRYELPRARRRRQAGGIRQKALTF